MWDGYKIDIVPHLMDPEGKPVKLLEIIAERLSMRYETDVTARIQFERERDYKFEFMLEKQRVSNLVAYSEGFIEKAMTDEIFLDGFVIHKHFRPIDNEIAWNKIK